MGISEIIFAILIAGGAVYLLWRSIGRKKGNCCGCGCSGSCGKKGR